MKRLLRATLALCVVAFLATPATAATVTFAGTVSPGNALFAAGTAVNFTVHFTPAAALVADITSATLSIGAQSWAVGAVSNGVTLTQNAGANNDDLSFAIPNFGVSSPGGWGTLASNFALTIDASADATDLTLANINALAASGAPASGAFFLLGGLPVAGGFNTLFAGTGTAVPEPGSIALLSCFGLVFGRGAMKRRKLATQVAA